MAVKGPLGWAILGCGRVADRRIGPVFRGNADAHLVAVASRDPSGARAFAARHGARQVHDSLDGVLSDANVHAVYIATPNALHAEHVRRCLAAGKHVLVEKPMALSAQEAADLAATAAGARLHLGVMHQQRFHPANMHLIRLHDEGRLGKLNVLRVQIGMWYPPAQTWRDRRDAAGGGAAMDLGPHALDLMLQVGGDVATVEAFIGHLQFKTELEDFCSARLHFRNGAVGLMELAYCMHDYGGRVEAYGSEATFVAHGSMQQAARYQTWFRRGATVEPMTDDAFGDCFRAALDDFTDAVLHGGEPTVGAEDGVRVSRIVDAVYESAARRAAVSI